MPIVKRPQTLAAAYAAASKKIQLGEIPTLMVESGQRLFRSINPASPYSPLTKPIPGKHVSKFEANKLLVPADGASELENRFSGPSHNPGIRPASGLYCALQQQALVNESMHY